MPPYTRELNGAILRPGTHHRLALVSASDTSLFNAISTVEFISGKGDRLIFHLTAAGRPAYFIGLNENDADFYIFNDSPHEKPGLNKPSWRALTGTYKGYVNRQEELVRLYMKNGYLYSSSGGATKVRAYKPGIYFTTDGESLLKKGNKIILGNRSYTKQ